MLLTVGTGLVLYPLVPRIQYALHRPTPTVPYTTRLTADSSFFSDLHQLPVIENKPIPPGNRLVIPSIGTDMDIMEGKDQKVLDRGGIWHIPDTSSPDKQGNTVLSGHRWQYLPPSSRTLYLLDKVKIGEPIIVYWQGKEYDYRVTDRKIVTPDQTEILNNTTEPQLTIYTCTPLFSTKQRLVLIASLIT